MSIGMGQEELRGSLGPLGPLACEIISWDTLKVCSSLSCKELPLGSELPCL